MNDVNDRLGNVPLKAESAAVEAWFAAVGLEVAVVDRCPEAACSVCAAFLPHAA
jgi:hypothetical protein